MMRAAAMLFLAAVSPAAFGAGDSFEAHAAAGEQYSLLMRATISPRVLVAALVDRCVRDIPELNALGVEAKQEWERRNSEHIARANRLLQQIENERKGTIGEARFSEISKTLHGNLREAAVQLGIATVENVLGRVPESRRMEACATVFARIRNGVLDIPYLQREAYRLIADGLPRN